MKSGNELDIIDSTRGKVLSDRHVTGENMFLIWGYPTVVFLLLEFISMQIWNAEWCMWLWAGIPLVGVPLMFVSFHKEHMETHRTERREYIIMRIWIFIGIASCVTGFATGFAGIYEECFFGILCLLCGFGCFLTGEQLHFRPMVSCGVAGSLLSVTLFCLQDELWQWQIPASALIFVITLIIPGHIFRKHVRYYGI